MGNVRSTPTGGPQRPKGTAIIKGETVEELARHTVRWTSLFILVASFVGAIIAFNGRWPDTWHLWEGRFWTQLSFVAIVAGIALQGFCTLMEWANRKHRYSPKYLGPLTLDIGSTYIGYAPLLIPAFRAGLARAGLPELVTLIIANIGVVLLALWVAYYPEQNLIEE
jgi:hypothetical protein